mmetsp:Transcript_1107/g.3062  ORF Transcript_1107/g.3062 Transcript_1107/m.3062 type:complete len:104 (+) Transcript_1107:155-466(+)
MLLRVRFLPPPISSHDPTGASIDGDGTENSGTAVEGTIQDFSSSTLIRRERNEQPPFKVDDEPTMINFARARVIATFILLQSRRRSPTLEQARQHQIWSPRTE